MSLFVVHCVYEGRHILDI